MATMRTRSLADVGGPVSPIADSTFTEKTEYKDGNKTVIDTYNHTEKDPKQKEISETIKDWTCNGFFWLFILVWVAVIVMIYFMAAPEVPWWDNLQKLGWMNNSVAFYVVLLLTSL